MGSITQLIHKREASIARAEELKFPISDIHLPNFSNILKMETNTLKRNRKKAKNAKQARRKNR
jgi:hypothetical protein